MPELPEVETVRRDLEKNLLHKKINKVEVLNPGTIGSDFSLFIATINNSYFKEINRRGKLLIFVLNKKDSFLLIHLKMTGQLIYLSKNKTLAGGHSLSSHSFEKAIGDTLPNRHTRVIINFSDNSRLFFNDLRKFGYMKVVNQESLNVILANNYGPEPLGGEFKLEQFLQKLGSRRISIKAALLDQKVLAGLGNIYVDEILFEAGVRPERQSLSISREEVTKIYKIIPKILKKAILSRGTTFSNYVDGSGKKGNFSTQLKVYGRAGEKCPQCGLAIIKTKVAGRGTHYCSACQS